MSFSFLSRIRWTWMMRRDPGCYRAFAFAYWRFLLTLLIVAGVLAGCFGGWLLWLGLPSASESDAATGRAETLSREKLRAVLDQTEQQGLIFQELAKAPIKIGDPLK